MLAKSRLSGREHRVRPQWASSSILSGACNPRRAGNRELIYKPEHKKRKAVETDDWAGRRLMAANVKEVRVGVL